MSLAENLKLEGLRLDVDGYVSTRLASFSQVNSFNISNSTWEYHRHYLIKALSRCPYAQEIEESSKNVRHFINAISRRVTIVRQVHAGGCFTSSACPFHYEHAIIARESI